LWRRRHHAAAAHRGVSWHHGGIGKISAKAASRLARRLIALGARHRIAASRPRQRWRRSSARSKTLIGARRSSASCAYLIMRRGAARQLSRGASAAQYGGIAHRLAAALSAASPRNRLGSSARSQWRSARNRGAAAAIMAAAIIISGMSAQLISGIIIISASSARRGGVNGKWLGS